MNVKLKSYLEMLLVLSTFGVFILTIIYLCMELDRNFRQERSAGYHNHEHIELRIEANEARIRALRKAVASQGKEIETLKKEQK